MSGWELRRQRSHRREQRNAVVASAKVTELEMSCGWELRRLVEGSPRACEGWRRQRSHRREQRNAVVASAKVTELEMT